VITPAVERLRDSLGFPGMAIVQYHFDPDPHSPHKLPNHREHQVVYTGTHDHDTLRGWYESLPAGKRAEVDAEIGAGEEPHWWLIDLAFSSRAAIAMVQTQDVLGLGSEARMNMPGTSRGAWKWRLREGALTEDLARRLRAATEAAGRLGS
jgi:4-alpha-glucanotransferase